MWCNKQQLCYFSFAHTLHLLQRSASFTATQHRPQSPCSPPGRANRSAGRYKSSVTMTRRKQLNRCAISKDMLRHNVVFLVTTAPAESVVVYLAAQRAQSQAAPIVPAARVSIRPPQSIHKLSPMLTRSSTLALHPNKHGIPTSLCSSNKVAHIILSLN